jgi:predicted PurR-regulated permease PerM
MTTSSSSPSRAAVESELGRPVADPERPIVVVEPMTPVRAMKITAAVLFVLALAWLFWQIREIVLLVILGVLLAAAVEPLVNRMRRHGLSRGQGILLIYGALFLLLFGGLAVVVPPLIGQGQELVTNAPSYLDRFEQWVLASGNDAIRTYGGRAINRARELLQNPGAFTASGGPFQIEAGQVTQALGFLTSFVGIVFTVVSAMIVAYYWMTEKAIIKRLVLGLFPMDRRDRAHALWDEIEDKLGGWARGQVLLMLIIGGVSTVVYGALGLPSFFLLGIWAGITELIPFIGPFLGGGLAVIVAFTEGWQKAAVVLLFVIVLQQLEGNVIVPRVMRNAVGLTPLSVILAVLVGSTLLGPLGAILAIPVAAAVQVLISELLRTREETDDDEAGSPLIRRLALGLPRRRGAAGGR